MERQRGKDVFSGTPPVQFFDNILAGMATPEEWNPMGTLVGEAFASLGEADLSPEESGL